MKLTSLGIIPARIGSSEIKRKNIRDINGKPLIYHTISSAINSKLSRVIVSTDSPEIADIAKSYGADVPFIRPSFLSTNNSKAIDVISHCLDWLNRKEKWKPDIIGYMQPTSPMRTEKHINTAISLMDETHDSVLSVTKVKEHPFYMFKKNSNEKLEEYIKMNNKPERRQDFTELYNSNPLVMFSWHSYLNRIKQNRGIIVNLKNFKPMLISEFEAVDINTELDFLIAENIMQNSHNLLNQKSISLG